MSGSTASTRRCRSSPPPASAPASSGLNGPFDLIVANILAGPLVALAPSIRRALAPGGTVILSGLLTAQRARVVAAYRRRPPADGHHVREGWLTLTLDWP